MIREILRAGGVMIVWLLASAGIVLLPPDWGAPFAVGISVVFLIVHAGLPFKKGNHVVLAAARIRSLPSLRSWIVAAVVLTPVWALTLGFVYRRWCMAPELV